MIRAAIKTTIFLGLMGTSFYYGEKLHPIETLTTKVKYFRVESAKNTPKDYLNWQTKVDIENDKAVLYLGNFETDKWKKVNEDGTVGSFGENIDDFIDEKKTKFQEYIEKNEVLKDAKQEIDSFGTKLGKEIYNFFN